MAKSKKARIAELNTKRSNLLSSLKRIRDFYIPDEAESGFVIPAIESELEEVEAELAQLTKKNEKKWGCPKIGTPKTKNPAR